ncbi:glycerophosphoryl diester phosphodiesterase [Streptomyces sp. KhCrAH-43]|uniref:glycerophosphodiester phosphodiesterase n=1 Tax=unclassified Streptomyces TaxID=2593676 RepID=UPI000372E3B6|nr:glycerophosphodiester phosphodiesterase family protein [Streptomyces sp. KhCrAH-43]MYS35407.1 glycerophosphodiester phosphodiesterase [Streptomyces sp. SID4920]MYX64816.1 glycerophosphodiester phosphodiesterase [Streptomyces sp. SID8373]RAJ65216.1 glycerophosphoryl diester phosphodiesterase [Streptomyces sp. KhCrAH-43]
MHAGTATATASVATAALMGVGMLLMSAPGTPLPDAPAPRPAVQQADPVRHTAGAVAHAPRVYAHRGASAYAPENTLVAVDRAHALGFDWVENDVQLTRDGVPVVLHDTNLKRTTNAEEVFPDRAPWAVKDFTAAEISRLDAGSWFGARYTGTRVPTLRRFLERLGRNRQSLLLEIKSPQTYPGIERATLAVLNEEGWLDRAHVRDRLVVQSFGADSLRRVHALRPDVVTGFLGAPAPAELPAYAGFADQINPPRSGLSGGYVAAVHALKGPHGKKLQVNPWVVDDAASARKVNAMGVDGIITDAPDVVRAATKG